jgi:hypothetical protein
VAPYFPERSFSEPCEAIHGPEGSKIRTSGPVPLSLYRALATGTWIAVLHGGRLDYRSLIRTPARL